MGLLAAPLASLLLLLALLAGLLAPGSATAQGTLPLPGDAPAIELPDQAGPGGGGDPGDADAAVADHHFVDEAALPFGPLEGVVTTRLWGVSGGAGYRIEVPEDWNGELVVWAWGFTGFCLQPDDPACRLVARTPWIRRHLVEHGYAWASTSLSTSGWAVSQGVLDNLALVNLFAQAVGPPDRTYMIGLSMGGKIAAISNERGLPYAGTLALCGELGQSELGNFWTDWNLVAATLAHEESRIAVPPADDYLETVVPDVRTALGTPFPSQLTAAGARLRDATAMLSGGRRPTHDTAFALSDVLVFGLPVSLFGTFAGQDDFAILLHGDAEGLVPPWPIDGNLDVVYSLDADPTVSAAEADLNARILRVAPRAEGDAWTFPGAEGRPLSPMLAVHGLGDLLVPLSLVQAYSARAAASGASDRVVTRAVRSVTHCNFTDYELTRSFDDLVAWVETDVRPPGDDFLDAAAISADDFGCAWSGSAPGVPRTGDEPVCTGD